MQVRPVFWFSSDNRRIINIAMVCNVYRRADGSMSVCTVDCTEDTSIDVKPEDESSFLDALRAFGHIMPVRQ